MREGVIYIFLNFIIYCIINFNILNKILFILFINEWYFWWGSQLFLFLIGVQCEMEQDHMVLAPTTTMSSACLLPVENFSQRISLIREMRNVEMWKQRKTVKGD